MTWCSISASNSWLFLPSAVAFMMVFLVYLLLDSRFHLAHLGFPVCPSYTPSSEFSVTYQGHSMYPVILEFLQLMTYRPFLLLAIDEKLLSCISNGTDACSKLADQKSFHFATFKVYSLCLPNSPHSQWSKESEENQITYRHISGISFHVILSQDRDTYWYFPEQKRLNQLPFAIITGPLKTVYFSPGLRLEIPSDVPHFLWQKDRSRFIECHVDLARTVKQNYDFYQTPPVINKTAIKNLVSFRDVMHRLRVAPMLFGGTLLGWYRECGIIPYTTDLDMVALSSEYTPELVRRLKWNTRIRLYWQLGKPDDSLELSVYVGGVKIDLFFLYREKNNSTWVGGMIVHTRTKLRWTYPPLQEICSADLLGQLFFIPCNFEEFIRADYGPQWKIPHHNSEFIWYKSHRNVKNVGKWSQTDWRHVYQKF